MSGFLRQILAASALLAAASAVPAFADDTTASRATTPAYLSVDILPASYVNNQLASGVSAIPEPLLDVTITARVFRHPVLVNQTLWEFAYSHPAGYVNNAGGPGSHYVDALTVQEYSILQSIGVGLAPGWFIEASQLYRTSNQFVDLIGIGIAGEKIPDFKRRFSLYGRFAYYPKFVNEDLVYYGSQSVPVNYGTVTFSGGAQSQVGRSNGFISYGVQAEYFAKMVLAPANSTKITPFLGYTWRVI